MVAAAVGNMMRRSSMIGSSNWDSRSLRLNFEVNLECFDQSFNEELTHMYLTKQQQATRVSGPGDINGSLPARLRNSICRLFSPYL